MKIKEVHKDSFGVSIGIIYYTQKHLRGMVDINSEEMQFHFSSLGRAKSGDGAQIAGVQSNYSEAANEKLSELLCRMTLIIDEIMELEAEPNPAPAV